MSVASVCLVIPCYNEEKRLQAQEFIELAQAGPTLLFVNDGSSDGTLRVLSQIEQESGGRVSVLSLQKNLGKAEAVRRGLLEALTRGFVHIGYVDADLATPRGEILRLLSIATESAATVVMGSRVAVAGAQIERHPLRHYVGRSFATIASILLRAPFYDTQCGAKVLRAGPEVAQALSEPFHSRWLFDVELLGRLLLGSSTSRPLKNAAFLEVPLREWRDVAGSKITARALARISFDLALIGTDLQKRRANQRIA